MHSIERYGIVALIFLVVTVVAVLVWDGDKAKKKKELAPLNATSAATAPLVAGADEGAKLAFSATPEPGPLVRTPHGVRGEGDAGSALAGAQTPSGGALASNPGTSGSAPSGTTPPGSQGLSAGNTGSALSNQGSALQNGALQSDPPSQEPREQPALDRPIAAAANASEGSTHAYVVRSGDTLSAIALSELGSSKRWQEITAANPGLDPSKLRVGKTIQLPGASSAQKATTAKSDAKTGDAPSTVAKSANGTLANGADAKTGSWKVGKGENLWRIAERALGDGKRWGEIAALNPSVNPDKLVLGQLLKLPAAPPSTPRGTDKTSSVKTAAKGAPPAAKNSATLVASASRSEQGRSGGRVK